MLRLLRSEVYRLRRRWMPWILLGSIVALEVILYLIIWSSASQQLAAPNLDGAQGEQARAAMREAIDSLRPAAVTTFGLSVVSGLGSVILIVLTASVVGNEFGWGTLRPILALGVGRVRFLATKYATLLLYTAVFVAVGTLAAIGASQIIASVGSLDRAVPDGFASHLVASMLRAVYVQLPYIALAALIAVLAKSSGAAIAIGLLSYFGESIVAQLLTTINRDLAVIADYGISRNVAAISDLAGGPSTGLGQLPDPGRAALLLAAWTVAFVGLALWRFKTRDITTG